MKKSQNESNNERDDSLDHNNFSEITPEILRLAKLSEQAGVIDSELFTKYEVKRVRKNDTFYKKFIRLFIFSYEEYGFLDGCVLK